MNFQMLDKLTTLIGLIANESATEDRSAAEVIDEEVGADPVVQQAILTIAKRAYKILGPYIDTDRMAEIVKKSGVSAAFFDRYVTKD